MKRIFRNDSFKGPRNLYPHCFEKSPTTVLDQLTQDYVTIEEEATLLNIWCRHQNKFIKLD